MAKILLVEDERVIRAEIERILTRDGHEVIDVASVPAAEKERPESFDLVITDVRLTGETGDVLIERVGQVPVIVMTAYGSVGAAVDAMKRGAADYLSKPFEPEELSAAVDRVLRHRAASAMGDSERQLRSLRHRHHPIEPHAGGAALGAQSRANRGNRLDPRRVRHRQGADRARRAQSERPHGRIRPGELRVDSRNAARVGAVRTREGCVYRALCAGTMAWCTQPTAGRCSSTRSESSRRQRRRALLRMLQQREVRRVGAQMAEAVDIRLIAATHRNLPILVEQGEFPRGSLLSTQGRRDPTSSALRTWRRHSGPRRGVHRPRGQRSSAAARSSFRRGAVAAIKRYKWPGNVRELQHAVERAVILHESGPITEDLLGLPRSSPPEDIANGAGGEDPSLEGYLRRFVLSHQDELQRNRAREASWHQPQDPLGTPTTHGHSSARVPAARTVNARFESVSICSALLRIVTLAAPR